MLRSVFILTALVSTTIAHFSVQYPYWRGDSYETQWERPCGGVNQTESDKNRTAWPLDGGQVVFKGSHVWAYTFVNLGLGEGNTTNFNITLVEGFNQTGNGTFCFPKLRLPAGVRVENGSEASIQVIQVNEHGSALYNCADIVFSDAAQALPSDQCTNSTGVGGSALSSEKAATTSSAGAAAATGPSVKVEIGRSHVLAAGLVVVAGYFL